MKSVDDVCNYDEKSNITNNLSNKDKLVSVQALSVTSHLSGVSIPDSIISQHEQKRSGKWSSFMNKIKDIR